MTDQKPFRELVGLAIGRASVCWDELPSGVFDSTTASTLVDKIVAAYDQVVKERDSLQDQLDHCSSAYQDLGRDYLHDGERIAKLEAALNTILILAAGETAYTMDFTGDVQILAREALDVKPNRWPY